MHIETGTHALGPDDAKLTVKTGRKGAAAKAGHDLVIEVTSWRATLEVPEDPAQATISVTADSRSFRVLEGTGGMKALDDDDKANIKQTIDDEVLKGGAIEFHSSAVEPSPDGGRLRVQGELDLLGKRRPIAFELTVADDGRVTCGTTVKQSEWGIKPYSALFGALKVADEVQVEIDGRVPTS
jgi:polyisoprenoid-binding protein YceI